MRAVASLLFAVVVAGGGASGVGGTELRQDGVVAAVPAEFPPWYEIDGEGRPRGFAIELFDAVADRARLEVRYEVFEDWEATLEAVRTGAADLIPSLGRTAEREADLLFTTPTEALRLGVFVRAGYDEIAGVEHLADHRVAAVRTNAAVAILESRPGAEVVVHDDHVDALFALLAGDQDALVYPERVMLQVAGELDLGGRIELLDEPLAEIERAIAVRPGGEELVKRLDAALKGFVGGPEYQRILVRWFGPVSDTDAWATRNVLGMAALVFLAGLGSMAAWRYRRLVRLNRDLAASIAERETAQQRLRSQERRYRTLVEHASDAIILADGDGRIVEVNDAACRMLGYDREELVGLPGEDLLPPDDRDGQPTRLDELRAGGRFLAERRLLREDGALVDVESSSQRLPDGRLLAVIRDISERKAARQALERSEAMFSKAFRASPSPMAMSDLETGTFVDVNDAWVGSFGFAREEALGSSGTDLGIWYADDARSRFLAAVRQGESLQDVELRLRRRDGSPIIALVSTEIVEVDGRSCILSQLDDITQRKLAERALVRQTTFLRLLQEVTLAANEPRALEEVVQIVITRVCDALGWPVGHAYSPGDDGRLEPSGIWHLDDDDRFARFVEVTEATSFEVGEGMIGRVLASGEPEWFEDVGEAESFLRVDASEDLGVVSAFAVPVFVGREPVAVLEFFHHERQDEDLVLLEVMTQIGTQVGRAVERQRAEEQRLEAEARLRQSQKMEAVGQLAGGVAHDFNNLLTVILGETALASSRVDPDDPLAASLQQVEGAAERAAELTRQLLMFSRRQVTVPEVFELDELVRQLDKLLQRLLGEDIEIDLRLSAPGALVEVDRGQLEQVIVNLAINGRDAMPGGGQLTIATRPVHIVEDEDGMLSPGEHLRLEVRDTGIGIDPSIQDQVFQPFFTTKGGERGSGLGLATCYGIVRQAGGRITLESEMGEGTTFRVDLPRATRPPDADEETDDGEEAVPQGTGTVLLVEDEKRVRELGTRVLQEAGYEVIAFPDAEMALEIDDRRLREVDLLLTDVVLPGRNGRELAEALGERCETLKILFMTGYTDDAILHRGLLDRSMEMLQKPFTPDGLAHRVRQVLDEDVESV